MSTLKGYRTVAINGAILLGAILASLTGSIDDPQMLKNIVIAQSIVNVALRFLTNTPVGGTK